MMYCKQIKLAMALAIAALLSACAHPIQVSPDLNALRSNQAQVEKIDAKVAYYISDVDMTRMVQTAGGGGDKVEYTPYKDADVAFYTTLASIFSEVEKLPTFTPGAPIEQQDVSYIFLPKIITNSSSNSAFTWPPTDFKFELTCIAYGNDGAELWKETVHGDGHAEFDEFVNDFSLSGRRATADAMVKMQKAILKHTHSEG